MWYYESPNIVVSLKKQKGKCTIGARQKNKRKGRRTAKKNNSYSDYSQKMSEAGAVPKDVWINTYDNVYVRIPHKGAISQNIHPVHTSEPINTESINQCIQPHKVNAKLETVIDLTMDDDYAPIHKDFTFQTQGQNKPTIVTNMAPIPYTHNRNNSNPVSNNRINTDQLTCEEILFEKYYNDMTTIYDDSVKEGESDACVRLQSITKHKVDDNIGIIHTNAVSLINSNRNRPHYDGFTQGEYLGITGDKEIKDANTPAVLENDITYGRSDVDCLLDDINVDDIVKALKECNPESELKYISEEAVTVPVINEIELIPSCILKPQNEGQFNNTTINAKMKAVIIDSKETKKDKKKQSSKSLQKIITGIEKYTIENEWNRLSSKGKEVVKKKNICTNEENKTKPFSCKHKNTEKSCKSKIKNASKNGCIPKAINIKDLKTKNILNKTTSDMKISKRENTFGAIVNSKLLLKNYIIPKIKKIDREDRTHKITQKEKNKNRHNEIYTTGNTVTSKNQPINRNPGNGLVGYSVDNCNPKTQNIKALNIVNKNDVSHPELYCELSLIQDEVKMILSDKLTKQMDIMYVSDQNGGDIKDNYNVPVGNYETPSNDATISPTNNIEINKYNSLLKNVEKNSINTATQIGNTGEKGSQECDLTQDSLFKVEVGEDVRNPHEEKSFKIVVDKEEKEKNQINSMVNSQDHNNLEGNINNNKSRKRNTTEDKTKNVCHIEAKTKKLDEFASIAKTVAVHLSKNKQTLRKKKKCCEYVSPLLNKILVGRFVVDSMIHFGLHSHLLRAKDRNNHNAWSAVKVLPKTFLLNKKPEVIETLLTLTNADQMGHFHCIGVKEIFVWNSRWCIAMDCYPKTLMDALNPEKDQFHIDKVQKLCRQLLEALMLLRIQEIVHTDIKPEHILLNEDETKLKLCGFDDARECKNVKICPTLGTLNYRAPEIILGVSVSYSADIWATACTMFEMATKKMLFESASSDLLLENIIQLKGPVGEDIIKKGRYSQHYFSNNKFKHSRRSEENNSRLKSINSRLFDLCKMEKSKNCKKICLFINLLDGLLTIDCTKRKTIELAYIHPFIYKA